MTAVIVIVVIVVIAALAAAAVLTRRQRLRRQFGPEYDRAVEEQSSTFRAEAELAERQRRVRRLDITPLSAEAKNRYTTAWLEIQERFVDAPQAAVSDAYDLVTRVMADRGYPAADDDQAYADLSVDHAQTVGHFRSAREITRRATGSSAADGGMTEELRQALIHYRALFSDLLGVPEPGRNGSLQGSGMVYDTSAETGAALADETFEPRTRPEQEEPFIEDAPENTRR